MRRDGTVRFTLMAAAAAMVSGCVSGGALRLDNPTAVAGPADLKPLPLALPANEAALLGNRKVDWGLALSGGGLRAALFSYGVLKGLYDNRLLDRIDIISTVSGDRRNAGAI